MPSSQQRSKKQVYRCVGGVLILHLRWTTELHKAISLRLTCNNNQKKKQRTHFAINNFIVEHLSVMDWSYAGGGDTPLRLSVLPNNGTSCRFR